MRTQGRQLLLGSFLLLAVTVGYAQTPATNGQGQDQATAPAGGRRQRLNDGQGQPLFGKIVAINKDSLEIAKPDGSTTTVKISDKTEFRKERQPAKQEDFKAGDLVFIRGEENADHSVTALTVGARSGGAMGGPGGGPSAGFGEMGKDFVVGEVKSVDAPKLTVLRPDNVTQTLELNEDTSLRKGRDSITMADIQAGDHVVVRGGLQNNAFVPKNVIVLSEEQWKRMQEMGMMNGRGPAGNAAPPPTAPKSNPPQA